MSKWITPNWSVGVQLSEDKSHWSFGITSMRFKGKRVFIFTFGRKAFLLLPRFPKP
jgi:hypothetical protein